MFRTVPMMRLSAFVLARHERAALRTLGRMGAVQLTRAAAGDDTAPVNPPDRSRQLADCDRLLGRIAEIRRSLGITAGPCSSAAVMTFDEAKQNVDFWEKRISGWAVHREHLHRRWHDVQTLYDQVRPYSALELPLDQPGPNSLLHFLAGTLPSGVLERITLAKDAALLPLPIGHQGRQSLIAVTTKAGQAALEETLRQAGFQRDMLPVVAGVTTGRLFMQGKQELGDVQAQLEGLDKEGQELAAAAAGPLAEVQRFIEAERRLCDAEQLCPGTAASVLITGWVPAAELPAVRGELEATTNGCCVVEAMDPKDTAEEDIPVLLRHSRWLDPFQILVTAYGFPRYRELVPTLFVAISYMLMFGMMFGDVGHGGLLTLAGAGLLWARRDSLARGVAVLLLANGLSSATFGAVYGSYFGLPQFKQYALWHDPLEGDPMTLMLVAMGLGAGLMSVGLGLNIINHLRRGELVSGLLDKFGLTGVIFYWGALLLVTRSAAIQALGWWNWALVLFLAAPIACWAIKEPLVCYQHRQAGHKVEPGGMGAALMESLVGAFEGVLLYLANTISFVRLAAYAMSHAALLMATFTLADQVRGLSGGMALGVIIVILGNAVAIVLEGLVAAVQALRLEYYEFFGKFFPGDGQPFRPFSLVAQGRG